MPVAQHGVHGSHDKGKQVMRPMLPPYLQWLPLRLQGRLFLTRDSKLAARRDVGGSVYLLDTGDTAQQLSEISKHFGIR